MCCSHSGIAARLDFPGILLMIFLEPLAKVSLISCCSRLEQHAFAFLPGLAKHEAVCTVQENQCSPHTMFDLSL